MCEYFGYKVVNLKRLRVINIRLGNLRPGEYRHLTKEEETELRRLVERKEEVKTKREEAQPDNKMNRMLLEIRGMSVGKERQNQRIS